MRFSAGVTLILTALSGGCGAPQATPTSQPPGSGDERADTAARAGDAGIDQTLIALVDGGAVLIDGGASVGPSVRSSLTFTNITGTTGDQTAMMFLPTVQTIEGCGVSRGGKLIVRLHMEKGKLVVEPQAGSSLDPTARRCVLDALSGTKIGESSNLRSGPMIGPTGFTSLLTIEW